MKKYRWNSLKPEVRDASMQALRNAGEHILGKANQTVPHREGHLQRSGIVTSSSTEPRVHISYDTPYARRLHEHPGYNFRNGRRGKWLERTMKEEEDKVRNYIKNALARVLN